MFTLILLGLLTGYAQAQECQTRKFSSGTVCVCDSDYCDTVPQINVASGFLQVYSTGKSHPGFNVANIQFTNVSDSSAALIRVNSTKYQTIIGFGGAFTDATGYNIKLLPLEAQNRLLESYFGENGIEYSLGRVPVGGTDFSPRAYTLDDHENDSLLEYFELQPEDFNYKIPIIQAAKALRKNQALNLYASAWTAPLWMKDEQIWSNGFTVLREEYYQVFADYMLKFFEEYQKQGVEFWGLTTGNEPVNGFRKTFVNCMAWTIVGHGSWISDNLGPTLQNSDFKNLKVMIHDDNLLYMPFVAPVLLNDEKVLQYVDGVAIHWYGDSEMADGVRVLAKSNKKDTFILSTEACHFGTQPDLGSWTRAQDYIDNIIKDLEYDYAGWVDWNMVLNYTGGYTHINKPADSPIIISEDAQEFYKQPMFYVLGHFSKFVVPDSVRMGATIETNNKNIKVLSFIRPDNIKVVTISNKDSKEVTVQLQDGEMYSEVLNVPSNSITTLLYQI